MALVGFPYCMNIVASVVLLTLLFGVGLCGVAVAASSPAAFFAGLGILFVGVLFGTVVILIANARRHDHRKRGHGRVL